MDNKFKPGEKGFAGLLLLFGLYFFYESVKLYKLDPRPSAYGAVPMFVSGLISVFSLAVIISDRNKKSETEGMILNKKIIKTFEYAVPKDVLVILVLIALYCMALYMGFGFIPVTSGFLWLAMCYLMKKSYAKNILWTLCCMVFIIVVFKYLFKVVLP